MKTLICYVNSAFIFDPNTIFPKCDSIVLLAPAIWTLVQYRNHNSYKIYNNNAINGPHVSSSQRGVLNDTMKRNRNH